MISLKIVRHVCPVLPLQKRLYLKVYVEKRVVETCKDKKRCDELVELGRHDVSSVVHSQINHVITSSRSSSIEWNPCLTDFLLAYAYEKTLPSNVPDVTERQRYAL